MRTNPVDAALAELAAFPAMIHDEMLNPTSSLAVLLNSGSFIEFSGDNVDTLSFYDARIAIARAAGKLQHLVVHTVSSTDPLNTCEWRRPGVLGMTITIEAADPA